MAISRRALLAAQLGLLTRSLPAAAAERFSVSQYGIIPSSIPWAVALRRGMLREEGLDIDGFISGSGGGTSVRNMLASQLPFAEVAVPAAIALLRTGVDVRFVYNPCHSIGELSWVVLPDSPVRSVADLRGRKAAFTAPRSTTEMVLRMVLDAEHIAGSVQLLASGGMGPAQTLLNQRAVDATPMADPVLTQTADRYRTLFRVVDYVPQLIWSVGITTKAFADAQPDKLRALIRARRRAVDWMYAERDACAALYAEVWEIDRALAAAILPKFFAMNFWSRGDFSMPGLDTMLRGMRAVGELTEPLDLGPVIDRRFLPEDLRS